MKKIFQSKLFWILLALAAFQIFSPLHELGHMIAAFLVGGRAKIMDWDTTMTMGVYKWQMPFVAAMGEGTCILVYSMIAHIKKSNNLYLFAKVHTIATIPLYFMSHDFDTSPMSIFLIYIIIIFSWWKFLWGNGDKISDLKSVRTFSSQSGIGKVKSKSKSVKKISNREAWQYQKDQLKTRQK